MPCHRPGPQLQTKLTLLADVGEQHLTGVAVGRRGTRPATHKTVSRRGTRPAAHKTVGRRGTRPAAHRTIARRAAHRTVMTQGRAPPAMAGTMDTASPDLSSVFKPSRKRMSSSPT